MMSKPTKAIWVIAGVGGEPSALLGEQLLWTEGQAFRHRVCVAIHRVSQLEAWRGASDWFCSAERSYIFTDDDGIEVALTLLRVPSRDYIAKAEELGWQRRSFPSHVAAWIH